MHLVHTRINAAASLGLTVYLTASEVNKLYPVIRSAPVSNRGNAGICSSSVRHRNKASTAH